MDLSNSEGNVIKSDFIMRSITEKTSIVDYKNESLDIECFSCCFEL